MPAPIGVKNRENPENTDFLEVCTAMRRCRFRAVLMIPLLLLAGCGEREAKLEKGFDDFREALIGAERVTVRAELTADYGGSAASYVLDAACDGTETTVTVVEPALIAGVTAAVKWGETSVVYDGVMLGAGPVDEDGLTPVSAVPSILAAMAGGYVELLWWDGDYIAARTYVSEASRCTVWLEADTLTPVSAEIACDGRRAITCVFTNWEVLPGRE